MPNRTLFNLACFVIAMTWATTVYAASAGLTPAPSLDDLPLRTLVIAVGLAIVGGAARTAQKLANPATAIPSIPLLIVADILTSVVVGMATFFLVAWREFHPLLQAFIVTVGGYGGSTILENYVAGILRRFNGVEPK